jgi:hypothetical protein
VRLARGPVTDVVVVKYDVSSGLSPAWTARDGVFGKSIAIEAVAADAINSRVAASGYINSNGNYSANSARAPRTTWRFSCSTTWAARTQWRGTSKSLRRRLGAA